MALRGPNSADDRPALGLLERGDLVERAENGGLAPVVDQVVVGQGRRDDVLRHRLVAGVHRVLAVGELRQVRLDLAERLVTGPPEQHRRALVLLATLELVGLLDELDVLEREADRGRADAEWGGTPAALDNSGATWHDLAGDQQTRRSATPARPRAAAPRPRPD